MFAILDLVSTVNKCKPYNLKLAIDQKLQKLLKALKSSQKLSKALKSSQKLQKLQRYSKRLRKAPIISKSFKKVYKMDRKY